LEQPTGTKGPRIREKPLKRRNISSISEFVYTPEKKKLIRPAGNELYVENSNFKDQKGLREMTYAAKKTDCKICEPRSKCICGKKVAHRPVIVFTNTMGLMMWFLTTFVTLIIFFSSSAFAEDENEKVLQWLNGSMEPEQVACLDREDCICIKGEGVKPTHLTKYKKYLNLNVLCSPARSITLYPPSFDNKALHGTTLTDYVSRGVLPCDIPWQRAKEYLQE